MAMATPPGGNACPRAQKAPTVLVLFLFPGMGHPPRRNQTGIDQDSESLPSASAQSWRVYVIHVLGYGGDHTSVAEYYRRRTPMMIRARWNFSALHSSHPGETVTVWLTFHNTFV